MRRDGFGASHRRQLDPVELRDALDEAPNTTRRRPSLNVLAMTPR
jgi:hypothetical protein